MMPKTNLCALFLLALTLILSAPVQAADEAPAGPGGPPPQTRYVFSYTPIYQGNADLDSGGSFDVTRHFLRLGANRRVNRQWMVGLGLYFDYEQWDFSEVQRLHGINLWDDIYRPGINVPVFYMPSRQWRFGIIPAFEFAGATGAEVAESMSYGATIMGSYIINKNLTVGLGTGAFERLGETVGYIFPLVDWKISDRWQLSNPLEAGPAGPAGLELRYRPDDRWTLGVGGAYRSYRFRLDDSSSIPDGIGQVDFWIPFARIGRQLGKYLRLDLSAGGTLEGKIIIEDRNARHIGETDYDAAPLVGLTLSGRF